MKFDIKKKFWLLAIIFLVIYTIVIFSIGEKNTSPKGPVMLIDQNDTNITAESNGAALGNSDGQEVVPDEKEPIAEEGYDESYPNEVDDSGSVNIVHDTVPPFSVKVMTGEFDNAKYGTHYSIQYVKAISKSNTPVTITGIVVNRGNCPIPFYRNANNLPVTLDYGQSLEAYVSIKCDVLEVTIDTLEYGSGTYEFN